LTAVTPHDPGGPTEGTIATVFDCVQMPGLVVVGRLEFLSGSSGCLKQVNSSYPFGDHVLDCSLGVDLADPDTQAGRFGRVCVNSGGIVACDLGLPPCAVPVETMTWGRIKGQYK
ncbi:MAG: hypothetical protein ACRD1Q_07945, partial [Vicinamibacterales bacterium]